MTDVDTLLSALEERASTARTIFMLLDSDADGLVAVEQARAAAAAAKIYPAFLLIHSPPRGGLGSATAVGVGRRPRAEPEAPQPAPPVARAPPAASHPTWHSPGNVQTFA